MKRIRRFKTVTPSFLGGCMIDIQNSQDNLKTLKDLNDKEGIYIDISDDGNLVVLYDENIWSIQLNKDDYLLLKNKTGNTITITPSFGYLNIEKNDNFLCKIDLTADNDLFLYFAYLQIIKNE
jgi:hypothetical protein